MAMAGAAGHLLDAPGGFEWVETLQKPVAELDLLLKSSL
jgi:hypothetical protein